MSLVQRVDLTRSSANGFALTKEQTPIIDPAVEQQNISLLRRVQSDHFGQREHSVTSSRSAQPKRETSEQKEVTGDLNSHSIAIALIDEVSNIIPILVQENEHLHTTLNKVREQAEADLEKATLLACEWRQSAEDAKLRVEHLEQKLSEMTGRAERAELSAASQKEMATKSSQEAAEAECLSSLFEKKLISSFGAGSLFEATLERIRNRTDGKLA